jgi:hypothetical protein
MKRVLDLLWPRPDRPVAEQQRHDGSLAKEVDTRIRDLEGLGTVDSAAHLDAARRIADEEDRRKSGAESRATTFIAGVAALIPLMTWAVGNATSTSMCSVGWGCSLWTIAFAIAVIYFITAAYWALQTLAVSNYYVIGVEDIVEIRENRKDISKELIRQTLMLAFRNRQTINRKLTFIQIDQRRFFNGLVVLGILLMFDPVVRLGVLDSARAHVTPWLTSLSQTTLQGLPPATSSSQSATKAAAPPFTPLKP